MSSDKISIVHVIESTATGTLSMCEMLANHQVSSGHDVFVIYSLRPESPVDLKSRFDSRVELINVQMLRSIDKVAAVYRLRRILKRIFPQVIFLHSSFAGFIGRLSMLGILDGAKIYYIPHCISFMRRDVGWVKLNIFILFEWLGAIKKSTYIACSRSEQENICARIPFRSCILVENSVDENLMRGKDNEIIPKSLVTVGQVREQKNPYLFASIARSILSKHHDATITWVGDGDLRLKKILVDSGVQVTGWVKKENIRAVLKKHTAYLSTSMWEGMPVSIIEAMYYSVPVIASNCAGNIDIIQHNETGWLYEREEQALHLIEKLFSNGPPDSIIANAYSVASIRFNSKRYFDEMDALLSNTSLSFEC